ncbi:uncharacterized protein LAJ45_06408 [Morchella importuna]|uniref:uncharacterized protein n=1 Tax=Morchella importuna TaxID=1174673 RepID=UPI001E8E663F|nr:uncharacterized protein LAJ45_06408 [Morchella importuna]KAH8149329.1 hypothetical protein LAJ45_06408 [Morchella importuna]
MIKAAITATKHIESPAENGASHNREGGPRSSISLDRTQPTEVESGAGIMEPLPSARLAAQGKHAEEREVLQKERDYYKRRAERYKEKKEELEKRHAAARRSLKNKETEIGSLSQKNKKMTFEVDDLKKFITRQDREITALREVVDEMKKLEETLAVKQQNIAELTEAISKSIPSVNTVTRDDAYFDGEFSGLAGAIRQWAFRYFRNGPEVNHRSLPPKLQEAMAATISDYFPVPDRTVVVKDIEASVTELILNWAFCWPQLAFRILGNRRPSSMLEDFWGIVRGAYLDRERQELQAQMIKMLMSNPKFKEALRTQILRRTSQIYPLFSSLLKAGCDDKCELGLFSILEKAAHLGFETSRQVSEFLLPQIQPGSVYLASIMEDTSDTVDEDEESTGKHSHHFTVQTVSFPPVQRRDLDETGTFIKEPVTIRRAMVTVKSSQKRGDVVR